MAHLIRRGGLSLRQEEQLAKLQGAGEHLLNILNAILDLSKIESGKFVLENTVFRPADVLADVVALVQGRAQAKGIALRCVLPDSLPSHLQGDRTRLQQALLNFVANAVKFTEHGEVCIAVSLLEETPDGLLLRFAVNRHRDRHRADGPAAVVRGVRAGRSEHLAQIRRDRPRAGHHPQAGRTDGGRGRGRKPAGEGRASG